PAQQQAAWSPGQPQLRPGSSSTSTCHLSLVVSNHKSLDCAPLSPKCGTSIAPVPFVATYREPPFNGGRCSRFTAAATRIVAASSCSFSPGVRSSISMVVLLIDGLEWIVPKA